MRLLTGQEGKVDRDAAEKYRKLPPEEKQKLKERMERLKRMTPEEREGLVQRIQKFKDLTPEKRERIRTRIQQLPTERKERLKKFRQFAQKMGIPPGARPLLLRWLKENRPRDLEELRNLQPEQRRQKVRDLMTQFHDVVLQKAVQENRMSSTEAEELRKLPFQERSRRLRELFRKNHQERHKARDKNE